LKEFTNAHSISENNLILKHLFQTICFGKSRSCLHRSKISFIYSSVAPYKSVCHCLSQVVTNSFNSCRHQRFILEKFFKNEISENISQKFHK